MYLKMYIKGMRENLPLDFDGRKYNLIMFISQTYTY